MELVYIVFEYDVGIVGVYYSEEKAKEKHSELPTFRYVEEYEVE